MSERSILDKKYRFRHTQQYAESVSAAPPLRPQVFI
nr:MAG TPA: hypothetical protein [Caudoviricetes sp.]